MIFPSGAQQCDKTVDFIMVIVRTLIHFQWDVLLWIFNELTSFYIRYTVVWKINNIKEVQLCQKLCRVSF